MNKNSQFSVDSSLKQKKIEESGREVKLQKSVEKRQHNKHLSIPLCCPNLLMSAD